MKNSVRLEQPSTRRSQEVWPGHLPATRKGLLPILEKAALGGTDFTVAERALFTACEFWAAAKARALSSHLGASAPEQLQCVGTIFAAIGAPRFAYEVDCTLSELPYLRSNERCEQSIKSLEGRLLLTEDPVDDLLGRFAMAVRGTTGVEQQRSRAAAYS